MADKKEPKITEEQPKAEEPKVEIVINNVEGKDVDERMADLLKDHQEMGVR